jgi:hypothetical protein
MPDDEFTALMMEAVRTSETLATPMTLHSATAQNTLNFILAAVKTSNLTSLKVDFIEEMD